MPSFSSKYNNNQNNYSTKKHNNRKNNKTFQSSTHKNNIVNQNEQNNQTDHNNQKFTYKSAIDNVLPVTNIDKNYFNNKSVYLPNNFKLTQLNRLNNINQLILLKEIKWGHI